MNNFLITLFLLSLPFERVLTFEAGGFTVKLSYMLGAVLILTNLAMIKRLKLAKEEYFLLLFVLWSYLTSIWSIDFKRTIIISTLYLFMAVIFIVLRRLFCGYKKETAFILFAWMGVLLFIFSLWQLVGDSFGISQKLTFLRAEYIKGVFPFARVQGTFLEPLFFANFMLIPFYLSLYKYITDRQVNIYFWSVFLSGTVIFLTLSRGAIFALLVSMAVFSILIFFRDKKLRTGLYKSFMLIIASFLLALFLIFAISGSNGIKSYFNQANNVSDVQSDQQLNPKDFQRTRNNTFKTSLEIIKENPFSGIGAGAFGALPQFKDLREMGNYQTVNNEYLEILIEEGIIGFLLISLFLIYYLIGLWQSNIGQNMKIIILSVIVAWLAQYLTFSNFYVIYIWLFLAFAVSSKNRGGHEKI
jgi:O-antigen ligase